MSDGDWSPPPVSVPDVGDRTPSVAAPASGAARSATPGIARTPAFSGFVRVGSDLAEYERELFKSDYPAWNAYTPVRDALGRPVFGGVSHGDDCAYSLYLCAHLCNSPPASYDCPGCSRLFGNTLHRAYLAQLARATPSPRSFSMNQGPVAMLFTSVAQRVAPFFGLLAAYLHMSPVWVLGAFLLGYGWDLLVVPTRVAYSRIRQRGFRRDTPVDVVRGFFAAWTAQPVRLAMAVFLLALGLYMLFRRQRVYREAKAVSKVLQQHPRMRWALNVAAMWIVATTAWSAATDVLAVLSALCQFGAVSRDVAVFVHESRTALAAELAPHDRAAAAELTAPPLEARTGVGSAVAFLRGNSVYAIIRDQKHLLLAIAALVFVAGLTVAWRRRLQKYVTRIFVETESKRVSATQLAFRLTTTQLAARQKAVDRAVASPDQRPALDRARAVLTLAQQIQALVNALPKRAGAPTDFFVAHMSGSDRKELIRASMTATIADVRAAWARLGYKPIPPASPADTLPKLVAQPALALVPSPTSSAPADLLQLATDFVSETKKKNRQKRMTEDEYKVWLRQFGSRGVAAALDDDRRSRDEVAGPAVGVVAAPASPLASAAAVPAPEALVSGNPSVSEKILKAVFRGHPTRDGKFALEYYGTFFVASGNIYTAGHCIKDFADYTCFTFINSAGVVIGTAEVAGFTVCSDRDLAFCPVHKAHWKTQPPALAVSPKRGVELNDMIYRLGCGQLSAGRVLEVASVCAGSYSSEKGESGSPIWSQDHNSVVGVHVGEYGRNRNAFVPIIAAQCAFGEYHDWGYIPQVSDPSGRANLVYLGPSGRRIPYKPYMWPSRVFHHLMGSEPVPDWAGANVRDTFVPAPVSHEIERARLGDWDRASPSVVGDLRAWNYAVAYVSRIFAAYQGRVLTQDETVQVVLRSDAADGAAGYGYACTKGEALARPGVVEAWKRWDDALDSGTAEPIPFATTLKREMLKATKAAAGKTRLFMLAPLFHYLSCVRRFSVFMDAWHADPHNHSAAGKDFYHGGWHAMMAEFLASDIGNCYASDLEGCDISLVADWFTVLYNILDRQHPGHSVAIWSLLSMALHSVLATSDGCFYQKCCGNPSGWLLTLLLNTVAVMVMSVYWVVVNNPHVPLPEMSGLFRLQVTGDDNLVGLTRALQARLPFSEAWRGFHVKVKEEHTGPASQLEYCGAHYSVLIDGRWCRVPRIPKFLNAVAWDPFHGDHVLEFVRATTLHTLAWTYPPARAYLRLWCERLMQAGHVPTSMRHLLLTDVEAAAFHTGLEAGGLKSSAGQNLFAACPVELCSVARFHVLFLDRWLVPAVLSDFSFAPCTYKCQSRVAAMGPPPGPPRTSTAKRAPKPPSTSAPKAPSRPLSSPVKKGSAKMSIASGASSAPTATVSKYARRASPAPAPSAYPESFARTAAMAAGGALAREMHSYGQKKGKKQSGFTSFLKGAARVAAEVLPAMLPVLLAKNGHAPSLAAAQMAGLPMSSSTGGMVGLATPASIQPLTGLHEMHSVKSRGRVNGVRIVGLDYIGAIDTGTYTAGELLSMTNAAGSIPVDLDLNPTSATFLGTRFAQFAILYERFRINRMVVLYEPATSAVTPGAIGMYIDTDPNDPYPTNLGPTGAVQAAAGHLGYEDNQVWQVGVSGYYPDGRTQDFYLDADGSDERLISPGRFRALATVDMTADSTLGSLYVMYDVTLTLPQIDDNATLIGQWATIKGVGTNLNGGDDNNVFGLNDPAGTGNYVPAVTVAGGLASYVRPLWFSSGDPEFPDCSVFALPVGLYYVSCFASGNAASNSYTQFQFYTSAVGVTLTPVDSVACQTTVSEVGSAGSGNGGCSFSSFVNVTSPYVDSTSTGLFMVAFSPSAAFPAQSLSVCMTVIRIGATNPAATRRSLQDFESEVDDQKKQLAELRGQLATLQSALTGAALHATSAAAAAIPLAGYTVTRGGGSRGG